MQLRKTFTQVLDVIVRDQLARKVVRKFLKLALVKSDFQESRPSGSP